MEYFHDLGLLQARMTLGCSRTFPVFVMKSHMHALDGWHTSQKELLSSAGIG